MGTTSSLKFFIRIFLVLFISTLAAQKQDEKAIKIAHKIMQNMGGLENWNNVNYIKWTFGKRTLHWNKWTGDVRVEAIKEGLIILININTNKGKVYINRELVTNSQKKKRFLKKAKNWWINDSYWLVMPWKLLDPGVTLKYIEQTKLENGIKADVIQMTFDKVGITPNNKYYVYVDQKDHLIKQWAFFNLFSDEQPKFTKPWDNYQKLENILFSFDRSDFGPKKVIVKKLFDTNLFTEL